VDEDAVDVDHDVIVADESRIHSRCHNSDNDDDATWKWVGRIGTRYSAYV